MRKLNVRDQTHQNKQLNWAMGMILIQNKSWVSLIFGGCTWQITWKISRKQWARCDRMTNLLSILFGETPIPTQIWYFCFNRTHNWFTLIRCCKNFPPKFDSESGSCRKILSFKWLGESIFWVFSLIKCQITNEKSIFYLFCFVGFFEIICDIIVHLKWHLEKENKWNWKRRRYVKKIAEQKSAIKLFDCDNNQQSKNNRLHSDTFFLLSFFYCKLLVCQLCLEFAVPFSPAFNFESDHLFSVAWIHANENKVGGARYFHISTLFFSSPHSTMIEKEKKNSHCHCIKRNK